jgi:hypothetical protein
MKQNEKHEHKLKKMKHMNKNEEDEAWKLNEDEQK